LIDVVAADGLSDGRPEDRRPRLAATREEGGADVEQFPTVVFSEPEGPNRKTGRGAPTLGSIAEEIASSSSWRSINHRRS